MKKIQTWVDLQYLKAECLPSFYVNELEETFLALYAAENNGESLERFSLDDSNCLYHLEEKSDVILILENPLTIEFVEIETKVNQSYFRIGKRDDQDQSISLIYFLEGTLARDVERRLRKENHHVSF